MNVKENNGCLFNVILILHKRRFNFIGVKYFMLNRVHIENLSSQAYAHVFSANFALDCVKNPCRAASPPADFCLVLDKIILENPHTFLVKTGSQKSQPIFAEPPLLHKVYGKDKLNFLDKFYFGRV